MSMPPPGTASSDPVARSSSWNVATMPLSMPGQHVRVAVAQLPRLLAAGEHLRLHGPLEVGPEPVVDGGIGGSDEDGADRRYMRAKWR